MKITLTGDRKIMNMRKVGTFIQSKSGIKNEVNTGLNPMNTGIRNIHYAYNKDKHKKTEPS